MHTRIIRSRPAWAAAAVVLAAALSACENPAASKGPPGLTLVSGAGVSDTVYALLPAPLIVDVRDVDGKALRGVEVVFRSRAVGVSPAEGELDSRLVRSVLTDRNGRVTVRVQLGGAAGPAPLEVSVPTQALADTADYTILPGAPLYMTVAPLDTAVRVGGSYALRVLVVDRANNPLPASTISTDPASSGVTLSGSTVQAVSPGRGHVRVRAGTLTAEAFVSAVPAGTLAASVADGVYQFSTDGTARSRVTAYGRFFRWYSDGQKFVYTEPGSERLRFSLPGGGTRIISTGPAMIAALAAHWSRDGEWVYFGGHYATHAKPYRVRADGTWLEEMPGYVHDGYTAAHPSPSPDETKVAYYRERPGTGPQIWIQTLPAGTVIASGIPGHAPEWSHGNQVAFITPAPDRLGPIRVMNGDGTGVRVIAPESAYGPGMAWSPDDRWIVARNLRANRLELVEVATGMVLPLPYSAHMAYPTWKP